MFQYRYFPHIAFVLGVGVLLSAAPRPAAADTAAFGFTSNATYFEDSAADFGATSYTAGYSFTVNNPILLTQLGYFYDPSFVGTNTHAAPLTTHDVGIYTSSGVLLDSSTVSYNGSGTGFSYTAATPLVLTTGSSYVIAGVTGPDDPFVYDVQDTTQTNNVGLTQAPQVNYIQDQIYDGGTSLANFPSATDTADGVDPGYFGPNFQFTGVSAAPEPSQVGVLALIGVGLCGLLIRARRRAAVKSNN